MTKKIFSVNGMKCVHCKANVENSIKSINGVNDAVADIEAKNVTVDFDDTVVFDTDIKNVVENSGRYELTL
ncbi:MAG: heavy-metal-associated domain-containing protein [Prevotella sp.]|jgi:copper chaperone|nr:heavy-metal-associated domain-containing protein [Prevotella sp.]MBP7097262.1 heavy-metal-associated domain-containing protein [Prevotella sp.]MBP8686361.1 heavy-metal-associated domain-containing protein [Prevotella sp.]MBP8934220.1 heavy-metal-associated domain-containing protein [Prevotella sp.]MBP9981998.1 heavy-metal-associated domain-containing protein [Prevotella sp.]